MSHPFTVTETQVHGESLPPLRTALVEKQKSLEPLPAAVLSLTASPWVARSHREALTPF